MIGAAVVLVDGVREPWQAVVLAAAGLALLSRRVETVPVLLVAAVAGAVAGLAGAPLP